MFGNNGSVDDVKAKLSKMTAEEQLAYLVDLTSNWNNEPRTPKLPIGAMRNAYSQPIEEAIHSLIKDEIIFIIDKLAQIYEETLILAKEYRHRDVPPYELNYVFKTPFERHFRNDVHDGLSLNRLISSVVFNSDLGIILNGLTGNFNNVLISVMENADGYKYIVLSLEINPHLIPTTLTSYRQLLLGRKSQQELTTSVKNINEVIAPAMATLNELKDLLPIFKKASGYITKLHDTFIKPKGDDKV